MMPRNLTIIGAGRVGRVLGRALRERGWRIGAVLARSRASARAAVRAIGGGTPQPKLWSEWFASDVILIALPDRAIESAANRLAAEAARRGRLQPARSKIKSNARSLKAAPQEAVALRGKIVLHTSGSLSHAVLAPLRAAGAAIGAMHPMQTFGLGARTRLDGVVFGLDGDARALRVARRMVRSLGGIPVNVKPQRKVIYHLAGAFAAPHLLAVLETGVRILMQAGYSRRQATHALCFMAQQNIANLERYGARRAWTGPLPRGDWGTVARHLAALRRFPAEYKQAYIAIARLAARTLARNPGKMLRQLDRLATKSSAQRTQKRA